MSFLYLDFDIAIGSVLDSSIRHFKNNYFIGTDDLIGDNEFEIMVVSFATFSFGNYVTFDFSILFSPYSNCR